VEGWSEERKSAVSEGQKDGTGRGVTAHLDHAHPPLVDADRVRAFERRQSRAAARRRLMERDELQDEFAATFVGLLPPSAVIIEGEPGMGKTALLNAACHLAAQSGHEVLRARGVALEAEAPFGVVRQVLQPIQDKWWPNEHMWLQLSSPPVNGTRRAIPFEAIHDLYLGLAHLASRQPLLVAIDDLHCADIESLWWVQHLVGRLEPGLSFVGSSLSRVAGTALGPVDSIIAEPSTRLISLRPLTARSVAELIRHHLGIEPDGSFVATCCRITGGNPFLVHSLLTALRQQGKRDEPSEEALSALSPPPVARAILRRLSELSTEAQPFIRAAAVLGDESDQRLVAELAGVDGGMGNDLANSLAEAHLLQRGRQLSFVYPLERSTVYIEIDPVRRARAHAEAARLLHQHDAPLEQVAHHLLLSEPVGDEWSSQSLEQVARLYAQRGQLKLAEKCLSRSLDESLDVSARPRRLLALASIQAATGRPGALSLLREAADLGADPVALADVTYHCLKAFAQELYPADTVATLRHLEEHLGNDNDELRIWIQIVLATWGPPSNAGQTEATLIESALAKRRLECSRRDRMALAHLSHVYSLAPKQRNADYVADLAEQALHPSEFQPEDRTSVVVTGRALIALARTGRFDVVDRVGQAMQDAALSQDHATSVAEFSTVLADSSLLQGNLDEGEVESRRALAATEGVSWASRPLAIGVLAASLMEEGRTMEAATALDNLPPVSAARTYVELLPLEQRARLKALDGRANEALEELLLVKEYAGELGITNPAVTSWRSAASSLLAQLGRVTEARDLAAENLELSRAFGAPQSLGNALRTAAEVGHPAKRIPLLEEAVDILTPSGASLECAKATIDLGAAYIDKGRQDEALRSLRRGADLAFHCRAQPLVERATRELRAAGARPRRLALMGSDALTPAERRVAGLAAQGLLNAQIAEKLFVSEKTVEGHLTRVYQKLGRQSRAQLKETLKPAFDIASEIRSPKGHLHRRAV
jgi:DNA-binding CsgD family transcriptional regulator/tetratricopeptide (TPR) repeat protein